jgi:hypothetical protein
MSLAGATAHLTNTGLPIATLDLHSHGTLST